MILNSQYSHLTLTGQINCQWRKRLTAFSQRHEQFSYIRITWYSCDTTLSLILMSSRFSIILYSDYIYIYIYIYSWVNPRTYTQMHTCTYTAVCWHTRKHLTVILLSLGMAVKFYQFSLTFSSLFLTTICHILKGTRINVCIYLRKIMYLWVCR